MPSFFAAVNSNTVNGVETDLRECSCCSLCRHNFFFCVKKTGLTKDGVVVLMHDATIGRTTNGGNQFVSNLTFAELEKFDAGSWFSSQFAGTKVPAFEELLQFIKPGSLFIVMDLKEDATERFADAVSFLVTKYDMEDRVIVSAWTDSMRDLFAARLPRTIMQKLGSFTGNSSDPLPWLDLQRELGYTSLSLNYRSIPPNFFVLAKQRLFSVVLWTVDSPDDVRLDVTGIITDDCKLIRASLETNLSVNVPVWALVLFLLAAFLLGIGFAVVVRALCCYCCNRKKPVKYSELN